jgi:hypothetical protein
MFLTTHCICDRPHKCNYNVGKGNANVFMGNSTGFAHGKYGFGNMLPRKTVTSEIWTRTVYLMCENEIADSGFCRTACGR